MKQENIMQKKTFSRMLAALLTVLLLIAAAVL